MKMKSISAILFCALLASGSGISITEIMTGKSIDKFSQLLHENNLVKSFTLGETTIFAPSDAAMDKYQGPTDTQFLLNHIVNYAVQLGDNSISPVTSISSLASGSPPQYIVKKGPDFFINGAKIIMRNLRASSQGGKNQRLHIIDQVLETPLADFQADPSMTIGLNAAKLLSLPLKKKSNMSLGNFRKAVSSAKELDSLKLSGRNTFFFPLDGSDESFEEQITKEVIRGHIVPGKLLFTNPIRSFKVVETKQDDEEFKIFVDILPDKERVKSTILNISEETLRKDTVIANVVKGNIPVSNGIVHFIDRPLGLILSDIFSLVSDFPKGRNFAKYFLKEAGKLLEQVQTTKSGTFFLPSNQAFSAKTAQTFFRTANESEIQKILALHFIPQRITTENIRSNLLDSSIYQVSYNRSGEEDRNLNLFIRNNSTFYVTILGSTAKISESDISATNGIVHVVDKVLGIPSQSIYDKLKYDPSLSSTFSVGTQDQFNDQLRGEDQQLFTYFVPSNEAWDEVKDNFLSAYKQIFLGKFGYQSRSILERHLLIGEALDLSTLLDRTQTNGGVQMLRGMGTLKVYNKHSDNVTLIEYEDGDSVVVKGDLKCLNGYIHVIDKVLMKRRDVTLSPAGQGSSNTFLLTTCFCWALIKSWI